MASSSVLPPPSPLEIHHQNAAEKWEKFSLSWRSYALALELSKKDEDVQVGTLVTVIGADSQEVYTTFTRTNPAGAEKIDAVLKQFQEYCEPKNVPFERYCFNQRQQQPGEAYDQLILKTIGNRKGDCA